MKTLAGNIAIFVPHSGCPQQCSFCNQRTISGTMSIPTGETAYNICKEALETLPERVGKVEIAFFGGSFTAVKREYMLELLQAVNPFLNDERVIGIRCSTRPDAIDDERLDILKKYGVTAIELGAQSMDSEVLSLNKRGHTAEDVINASRLIKEYGFSLGLQMMTGLFGSTEETDIASAEKLAALEPDTIRIYPTVVLKHTDLYEYQRMGLYKAPDVEETLPRLIRIRKIFKDKNITIIRTGLHASETMEEDIVGGCYHQALGELCINAEILEEIKEKLKNIDTKDIHIVVNPRKYSMVVGQKKRNIQKLTEMGYSVQVTHGDTNMNETYILKAK